MGRGVSTTVVAGAKPASAVRRDMAPVWSQIAALLAEMHVQAIRLRAAKAELTPLQRKLVALSRRLNDPALRAHPERIDALRRYDEWQWRERDLQLAQSVAWQRFADACRAFGGVYASLEPRQREEVLATLRSMMTDAAVWVRATPALRRLQVFREALPVWGKDDRGVSPEPPF